MEANSVINIVGTQCPPEAEERFRKWYIEKHIPELLQCEELKGVTFYRNTKPDVDYPTYLAVYEFKDLQDFEAYSSNPLLAAVPEDVRAVFAETGASIKWRVQFQRIKSWQR